MKSHPEIPSKFDYLKSKSSNFIENEKFNSELVHESNVGKIDKIVYNNGQITKSQGPLEDRHNETINKSTHLSRTYHEVPGNAVHLAPKRYTTTCFLQPQTKLTWCRESVLLKINSTKKLYNQTLYYNNKLAPFHWSENMSTQVDGAPKNFVSEAHIPVEQADFHYMSLEPQQFSSVAAH